MLELVYRNLPANAILSGATPKSVWFDRHHIAIGERNSVLRQLVAAFPGHAVLHLDGVAGDVAARPNGSHLGGSPTVDVYRWDGAGFEIETPELAEHTYYATALVVADPAPLAPEIARFRKAKESIIAGLGRLARVFADVAEECRRGCGQSPKSASIRGEGYVYVQAVPEVTRSGAVITLNGRGPGEEWPGVSLYMAENMAKSVDAVTDEAARAALLASL